MPLPEIQPLAPQPQVDPNQATWLQYLLNDNPKLKDTPGVAVGVASAGYGASNPLGTADAVSGFSEATQYMRRLQDLNPLQQYQAYHTLKPEQRAALLHMGYRLNVTPEQAIKWENEGLISPELQQMHQGFLSGVLHEATHIATSLPGVKEALGGISKVLGVIPNAFNRAYRTVELGALVNKRGEHTFYTNHGWENIESTGIGNAWNQAKDGNSILVDPNRISTNLDPELKQVLLDRAVGTSDKDLVAKYGVKTWSAAVNPDDEEAMRYAQALEDSKLGGGRGVARAIGIQEGTKDFRVASGLIDGASNILETNAIADGLGSALKAVRASETVGDIGSTFIDALRSEKGAAVGTQRLTRMISNGATVRQAYAKVPQFQRAAQFIADARDATGRISVEKVLAAFPQMPGAAVAQLVHMNPTTAEGVRDAFVSFADRIAHAEGKAMETGTLDLPTMSKIGASVRVPAKMSASAWLDRMATKPEAIDGMPAVAGHIVQPYARAIRGLLHNDLPKSLREFNTADDRTIKQFDQMLNFGPMDPKVRELFLTEYAGADPLGRAQLLTSTYKTAVEASLRTYGRSLADSPLLQKEMAKMDDVLERLKGNNGVPLKDENGQLVNEIEDGIGNPTRVRGQVFLNEGQTWNMPVPRMSQIALSVHATNFLHTLGAGLPELAGATQEIAEHPGNVIKNYKSMYEALSNASGGFINNIWRPMVLMHIGFPLRVALEEGMREMLQKGFMSQIYGYADDAALRNRTKALAAYSKKIAPETGAIRSLADNISFMTHAALSVGERSIVPEALHNFSMWKALNGGEHQMGFANSVEAEGFERDLAFKKSLDGETQPMDGSLDTPANIDNRVGSQQYAAWWTAMKTMGDDFGRLGPDVRAALPEIRRQLELARAPRTYFDAGQLEEHEGGRYISQQLQNWQASRDAAQIVRDQMSQEERLFSGVFGVGHRTPQGMTSWEARDHLGDLLSKNANYQRTLDWYLREKIGLPEYVKVYRGHVEGLPVGTNHYESASLRPENAETTARAVQAGDRVGAPIDVTELYIPRKAIVGIGSSGEFEVLVDTKQAAFTEPGAKPVNKTELKAGMAKAIRAAYDDPANAELLKGVSFSKSTPSRRRVLPEGAKAQAGTYTIERADALDAAANRAASAMMGFFTDKNGNVIEPLVSFMEHNGRLPSGTQLSKMVERDNLPTAYSKEAPLLAHKNLEKFYAWNFDKFGHFINRFSRSPMHTYEGSVAMNSIMASDTYKALVADIGQDAAFQWAGELANAQALKAMEGMVHDPATRSLFAQMHRNTVPFQFAHEQFLKRWAKTFWRNPEAAFRARLMMHGLRSVGFVHKDEQGNDIFTYPGSHFLASNMSRAIELVTGSKVHVPMPIAFTGRVDYLINGLDRPAMPGVSPFVAMPLGLLGHRIPEAKDWEKAITGHASESWWTHFVPTTAKNIIQAYTTSPDVNESTGQFQTAMFEATNMLMSNPQTALTEEKVANDPSGAVQQEFRDRAIGMARQILVMRAIFGFATPGTPDVNYYSSLSKEFKKSVSLAKFDPHPDTAFQDAVTQFIANHPDHSLYDTFDSRPAASGTNFNPTAKVAKWLGDNADVTKKYGPAATYLMPYDKGGAFDYDAYLKEVANHIRLKREVISGPGDTTSMWAQAQINADAGSYYDVRDYYLKAAEALHGDARRGVLDLWRAKKENYLSTRPIFKAYLAQAEQRSDQRQSIIDNLSKALQDPNVPKSAHSDALSQVIGVYTRVQDILEKTKNDRSAPVVQMRDDIQTWLSGWGAALTDPVARMFFRATISPGLPG